ncbi:mCG142086, isoform CRA_b [Mus musculus]|nr:mCG142086, isoform CRA_b [Mus musculus]
MVRGFGLCIEDKQNRPEIPRLWIPEAGVGGPEVLCALLLTP